MLARLIAKLLVLLALSIGCGRPDPQPKGGEALDIPPAIAAVLDSRRPLVYGQGVLDGSRSVLRLEYATTMDLVREWPTLTQEVSRVWDALRPEAESQNVEAALVVVKTPNDYASFEFHRGPDGGWTEAPRDLEMRALPGGKTLPVIRMKRTDDYLPTLNIEYASRLDVSDREAVQREVEEIWTALQEEADEEGVDRVIFAPTEGIHGSSRTFAYRRYRREEQWYKGAGFSPLPRFGIITLASGHQIKVESVEEGNGDPPKTTVVYYTEHDLDNEGRLLDEVDEVLAEYRQDAEGASVETLVIRAVCQESGRSRTFSYARGKDGNWARDEQS